MAGLSASDRRKEKAYRHAVRAAEQLDQAARSLGFDGVNDLAYCATDLDLPESESRAVDALVDSYTALNDGEVRRINPDRS